jgi:thioredoxin 1
MALSENVLVVNSSNFDQEVLGSAEPVLVDFWATWCPPCRMIAPTVDALAAEYSGRARVVKLDVDESPDVAQRFGVQSIPTLIVFKDGKVVDQRVGALPKSEMARMLDAHAGASAPAQG